MSCVERVPRHRLGARRWVGCVLLALSSAACASSRLEVGPDHPASAQAPLAALAQVGGALDPGFEPQANRRSSGHTRAQRLWPSTSTLGQRLTPSMQAHPAARMPLATLPTLWTCPMHPEIVRKEPGNCPICGMKLVPLPPKVAPQGLAVMPVRAKQGPGALASVAALVAFNAACVSSDAGYADVRKPHGCPPSGRRALVRARFSGAPAASTYKSSWPCR